MLLEDSLWMTKYRPKNISEYVFSNAQQKAQIEEWIKNQTIPQCIFYGPPGTGKSSLALALMPELNIDPYDILFINASRENSVDNMRNRITSFVSTMPYGKMRVVILDEADGLSFESQKCLRGIMEQFPARFILTANYPNKILPAIHSRTQSLEIHKLDINDFTAKMAEILLAEQVEFELDILDDYVRGSWPDLRKCINNCQLNSIGGFLRRPNSGNVSSQDYKIEAVELFKKNKFREARQLICSQIRMEELDEFFKFLYSNLDLFGKTPEQQDQAILIIRKSLVQIPLVADAEILVSATITELLNIS